MKTSKILARAAGLLRKHGWRQKITGDKNRGYCIYGAVNAACRELSNNKLGWGASSARAFEFVEAELGTNPVSWNDASDRKKTHVINALRDMSVAARNKGK